MTGTVGPKVPAGAPDKLGLVAATTSTCQAAIKGSCPSSDTDDPMMTMSRMAARPPPRSCDTFVFVGKGGEPGAPACTIFGKNSDRPSDEEHEVIFCPAENHAADATVQCTYISIPQAPVTASVVLSRPRWMFGCEMGANEHGVVGGNEAVGSALSDELGDEPRLLGMDLLRLALERSRSAREAADVCCTLLEAHGQGGGCEEHDKSWTYENGFLFADAHEAFILETAGVRHWALERVPPGKPRNISNGLSIRTDHIALSDGVRDVCLANGWWDGSSPFDWKACIGFGGRYATSSEALAVDGREAAARDFLTQMAADASAGGSLDPTDASAWCQRVAAILRDEASGICFRSTHGFCSTGSQISWLPPQAAAEAAQTAQAVADCKAASHLFTCASDPLVSAYKRFTFPQAHGPSSAPAISEGGASNFASLDLWREWRQVALRGGLERAVPSAANGQGALSRRAVTADVRRAMAEGEAIAMRSVAVGEREAAGSFAAAVGQERARLRAAVS